MGRHTLWQHLYYMQEALKTYFCTAFVGIRAAIKPFPGGKVPLVANAKKTAASEWNVSIFPVSIDKLHATPHYCHLHFLSLYFSPWLMVCFGYTISARELCNKPRNDSKFC